MRALQSRPAPADDASMTTLTLDDVVNGNVDGHPQPNAQAPEIVREVMRLHGGDSSGVTDQGRSVGTASQPASDQPAPGTPDSKGTPYDPAQHVTSGKYITARGTWRKRRDDDDSASASPGAVELPPLAPADDASTAGAAPAVTDHAAIADAWVDRAVTILRMALGDEWEPSPEQRRDLTASTARYMAATNWTMDLTPGWALLLSVTMYVAPRAALSSTRERVGAIIAGVTGRGRDVAAESQPDEKPRPAHSGQNGYQTFETTPARNPFGEAA